jgi:hypothetical protein
MLASFPGLWSGNSRIFRVDAGFHEQQFSVFPINLREFFEIRPQIGPKRAFRGNYTHSGSIRLMRFTTNPLPGMNPWLEAFWGDMHKRLTTYSCDVIQKQLPATLQARVEEYLSVLEPDEDFPSVRRIVPDVHIVGPAERAGSVEEGVVVQTPVPEEPIHIRRRSPPQTLRYIQIVDVKAGRRVITVIEFLSLANKATEACRKQYFAKQNELLNAGVNLVEIDLLRGGKWVLAVQQDLYAHRLKHPYRICVVRGDNAEEAEVYQATFAAPLPAIRIPLRATDNDVLLPLQTLVNQAYENGRYGNDVDYSVPPEPPLLDGEQKWIADYLAKR